MAVAPPNHGSGCPAIWQNPVGYFECTASSPSIGPDMVFDPGAIYDGIVWCEEDCGQLINDAGNLLSGGADDSGSVVTACADDCPGAAGGGGAGASSGVTSTTSTISSTPVITTVAQDDAELVNPDTIRFTQNSVSPYFQEGSPSPSIEELANSLRSGEVNPGDVPPLRVVSYDDNLYSLDNRRLVAFQQAGVDVPVVRVPLTGSYAEEFVGKFTTTPELGMGLRIIIRGVGVWPTDWI
jgi:hypothetical protein